MLTKLKIMYSIRCWNISMKMHISKNKAHKLIQIIISIFELHAKSHLDLIQNIIHSAYSKLS